MFISVGGGSTAPLFANATSAFVTNLGAGVAALVTRLGLDGGCPDQFSSFAATHWQCTARRTMPQPRRVRVCAHKEGYVTVLLPPEPCTCVGLTGVDFDVEHREGDLLSCARVLQGVVDRVRASGARISFAPQMVRS